ncbi:MAG: hypothetical protein IKN54_04155 [Lachnospiraceae bacterium]|nr:hypothetical protein [Lachnospiraceae bacterium]
MDRYLSIPQKIRPVGDPGADKNIKIYISKNIHRKVYSFARTESQNQIGGIMMGNIVNRDGDNYIILRDFVVAEFTSSNKDTLTFTKETWAYLDEEKKKFPGMQMVGWMHTNPNRGIEISEYDEFLQTHIFKNTYAVLYIVDPIQVVETYYYLDNNAIKKASGFYLYVEEGNRVEEVIDPMEKKETIDLNLADGKVHKVYADLSEDIPEVISEVKEIAFEELEDGEEQENEIFMVDKSELSNSVRKSLKKSSDRINGTENLILEEIDDDLKKSSHSTSEEDDFEARLARRKAEKYSRRYEESNHVAVEPSFITKVMAGVIGCMAVIIIVLGWSTISMAGKVSTVEKKMDALYQNDEIIANYINTGTIGEQSKEEVSKTEETTSEKESEKEEATKDSEKESKDSEKESKDSDKDSDDEETTKKN